MKKLLGILVLGLFFISSPAKAGVYGTGELKLGGASVNNFIKYLKGGWGKKPMVFLVTLDGRKSYYWYCPETECRADTKIEIQACENYYQGAECKIFARRRTVRWKNGVNPGKGKESKFNSKWSDSEIRAKLTELGFLGGTTSTTTKIEKKETKTTETTSSKTLYVATAKNKKDDQVVIQRKSKSMQDAKDAALKGCRLYFEPYGKSMQDACYIDDISEKKKAEKIKEPKKKMNKDIVQQLKYLEEMYKSGSLTKEEYTKAKKKLLN